MKPKAQPRPTIVRDASAAPSVDEMPALSTDERRALLAAQEAIETATDEQLAAARAHERAKCDIAERAADRDLVMRTALRRLKLSPDEWEFKIETTSGKAEIRRKGQSA